jgi:hypothetical protein
MEEEKNNDEISKLTEREKTCPHFSSLKFKILLRDSPFFLPLVFHFVLVFAQPM